MRFDPYVFRPELALERYSATSAAWTAFSGVSIGGRRSTATYRHPPESLSCRHAYAVPSGWSGSVNTSTTPSQTV